MWPNQAAATAEGATTAATTTTAKRKGDREINNNNKNTMTTSKLIHPSLEQLPQVVRFVMSGVIGNMFFMFAYNHAYKLFQSQFDAFIIFSVVQFFCIILNHFLNVSLVFGYPDNYWASLLSNMPVGLSSLALGAGTTSYLENSGFDDSMQSWFLNLTSKENSDSNDGDGGSFWTSIAVICITGIFNYVVLNIVNKPSSKKKVDEKKEL